MPSTLRERPTVLSVLLQLRLSCGMCNKQTELLATPFEKAKSGAMYPVCRHCGQRLAVRRWKESLENHQLKKGVISLIREIRANPQIALVGGVSAQ